jgi:hypothetical protein
MCLQGSGLSDKEEKMSAKRAMHIVLVAGAVILAAGAAPTQALPARHVPLAPETIGPDPGDAGAGPVPQRPDAASGDPLGSIFVIRDDPSVAEVQPAVVYNPDRQEYLVVFWNDRPGNDDIRAERVSRDGRQLGGVWVAAGAGADRRYPDVVYNGHAQEYLVVWAAEDTGGNSYIRGQRLRGTDAQLLGGAIPIETVTSGVGGVTHPAVAYASTVDQYLVVWEREISQSWAHIMGLTVSADGTPSATSFFVSHDPAGTPRRQPDVAYNRHANGFLVVWQQWDGVDWQIWSCLVDGDGPPPYFTPQPITTAAADRPPSVAAIPTAPGQYKFLVVWYYTDGITLEVSGRLVAENGTPHPFSLSIYFTSDLPGPPWLIGLAVAGDESGKRYMVAWLYPWGRRIQVQIHSYDGTEIENEQFSMPGVSLDTQPAVASGPTGDFLIAFQYQSVGNDWGIYGQLWGNRVCLPLVVRAGP